MLCNLISCTGRVLQVNCLQQLENIAAYPFLKEKLNKRDLFLHAFWYDVHSGNVLLLSKRRQKFVEINDRSYFALVSEVEEYSKPAWGGQSRNISSDYWIIMKLQFLIFMCYTSNSVCCNLNFYLAKSWDLFRLC